MTGPRCVNCRAPAVQRIVSSSMISFRCRKHSCTEARARRLGWRLFTIEPQNSVANVGPSPDCDGDTFDARNPAVRSANKEKEMGNATKEAKTPTAPKPGAGFTVVELRTPHQSDIVKASAKGSPAGSIKFEDRYVIVKKTDAQAVVDRVIGNSGSDTVGIFDRRVLDFFVAGVMLANKSVTDSRTSLHSRLIAVGRNTAGFRFVMKQDGTLLVEAGGKELGTQKEAMAKLDPKQVKAPVSARKTGSTAAERRAIADRKAEQAAADNDRYAAAKAESKALKAWENEDEGTRGPRPATPNHDALKAEYDAKEAAKAKEQEAKKAERAEAEKTVAAKKSANGTRKATPNPKPSQAKQVAKAS